MAARGRNSPGRGAPRRDARPGGQRGFKSSSTERTRGFGTRGRTIHSEDPVSRERNEGARGGRGDSRGRSYEGKRNERREGGVRAEGEVRRERGVRPEGGVRREGGVRPEGGVRREGGVRPEGGVRREGEVLREGDARPHGGIRGERSAARPRRVGGSSAHPKPTAGPQRKEQRTAAPSRGEPERLQKVLARMGVASRREAEEWIRAGRLTVNGEPAVLGSRVGRSDHLRLDGRLIHRHEVARGQVYLCHRSPGENLRTPEEPTEHQALMDRLPRRAGNRFIAVSPMPRADGGLEIVTSDGNLAVQLQRTVHSLPSEFSVRVRGELDEPTLSSIMKGTLDRGINLKVASLEPGGGEGANRWYTLVASGGSGKDVRQLFERHGALVSRVLRTKLGSLALDRLLSRGQFRPLTQDEIQSLLSLEKIVS